MLLETRRPRCFGLLDIPSTTRERGLCARGQTVRATRVDAAPPTDAATDAGFASSLSRSEPSITGQWTHLHTRPRSPPCTPSLPLGYAAMRSSFGSARPTPPYRRLIAVPEMLSQAVSSTLNVLLLATSNSAQSDASTAICAEHRALSHELEHFLRRPSLAQTSLHRS